MDGGAGIFKGYRGGMSLFPTSYNAVFTDVGAFCSRVNFFPQFIFLNNGASAVKSISKRSWLRQAILPPRIIEGNKVRCCTANCSSPKGVTMQPKTQKYSDGRGLIYPISIRPTDITNWMKAISNVSSLMHYLATI